MRAIVQRVEQAQVLVEGKPVGSIGKGLLVYVGVAVGDASAQADRLAEKLANLRIFEDENGKLNLSVRDVRGGVLAVSNFTLLADTGKGRRPALAGAAPAEVAGPVHEALLDALDRQGIQVETGVFGAGMLIQSEASGPVNVIIDLPGSGAGTSKPIDQLGSLGAFPL